MLSGYPRIYSYDHPIMKLKVTEAKLSIHTPLPFAIPYCYRFFSTQLISFFMVCFYACEDFVPLTISSVYSILPRSYHIQKYFVSQENSPHPPPVSTPPFLDVLWVLKGVMQVLYGIYLLFFFSVYPCCKRTWQEVYGNF